jgi:hypothetical protein
MPAFHECRVFMTTLLFTNIKETAAAGFKTSESLCLPRLDDWIFVSTL